MTGKRVGRLVSSACLAVVLGASFLAVPTQAATAPVTQDPFYGTWYDGLSPTPAAARAEMDRIAAAGVGLIRQYVWWDRIERSPGVYDWSRTDQLVTDATARGLRILPTLLYTPAFYSSKPAGSTSTAQFPPSDPQTMARFAAAMADRYGNNGTYWCPPVVPGVPGPCHTPYLPIKAWEVWNEPDFPSWWKGKPDVNEYAPLLRAVYGGIKGADPEAEVMTASLTNRGGSAAGGYLDRLYALGAADTFDTIAINPYGSHVAEAVGWVRGARAIALRYGDGHTPIRITEYGWASGGRSPYFVVDERCQAALLHATTQRFAALRTELNIEAITQFQWHDVAIDSDGWPYHAGLFRADDSAKPALGALTEAIAGRPAPPGLTVAEGCPDDRQALDVGTHGAIADDLFSRSTTSGWGSADSGGAYTVSGSTSDFAVSGGLGKVTVAAPGGTRAALLGSTSAGKVGLQVSFNTDKAPTEPNGQVVSLVARHVAQDTEYRVRLRLGSDATVRLSVVKALSGVETQLGAEVVLPGLTSAPGTFITLEGRLTGASPTTIEAKAWAIGDTVPADWAVTRTDSERALQADGAVGIRAGITAPSINGTVTFGFDDFHVSSPK